MEGTLVACIKHFFGFPPGAEGNSQLMKEYKQLTEKDKQEIKEGLEKNGYTITAGSALKAAA